ncbi:MAG TPA: hemolysin family protein [Calditrichia bacterium]|nr:hemolysin family protein [Calditrichia bacterium]HQV30336.1 hemolysin family protein [Calditrichia bacterium]
MGSELILFYALAFLILLLLSAFFSGSETAFFSLSPSAVEELAGSRQKSENRVAELLQRPRQLLVTIIIGNTVVNITMASLAAQLTLEIAHRIQVREELALAVEIVVVTLVILITSEILPKVIAVRKPEVFARQTGLILQTTLYLFYPLSLFLTRFTRFLQNSVGFSEDKAQLPVEELKTLVEVAEEHGPLEKDEKEMISSIFEFGETTAKEIMIPRTDMICVEVGTTLPELMGIVKQKLLSRIPVYRERVDNIVGILYLKDLLPLLGRGQSRDIQLEKLARPAYFVPEVKKIDDLLREFQQERIHMALVVDEYGGISGLVTLEDVIEEIVGEIQDEYDREQPLFSIVDENTFLVDGRMPLEEVNDELNLNLPTEEGVETISGFILHLLGSLPQEKEKAHYNNYHFVVEKIDKNRILKVRIEKKNPDVKVENEIEG